MNVEDAPDELVRQRERDRHLEQQRGLHPNDPRNDGSLDDLEQRIEDRADMLVTRYGYSEEYAFQKAQDDLCPID